MASKMRMRLAGGRGRARRGWMAAVAAGTLATMAGPASAALLTGSYVATPPNAVNLTTTGLLDWTIWTRTTSGSYADVNSAPDNRKLGVTPRVSNVTPAGASSLNRGFAGTTTTFAYADGASSPTALSASQVGGIGNSALDSPGAGVQVTILGDTAQTLYVNAYVGGQSTAQNSFRATLVGATQYLDTSTAYSAASPGAPGLYTLAFRPDAPGDRLVIQYTLGENALVSDGSHVMLQAVTVSNAVPEPAAAGSLLAGAALLGLRRRRHPRG